jgi:hypothetical protein
MKSLLTVAGAAEAGVAVALLAANCMLRLETLDTIGLN